MSVEVLFYFVLPLLLIGLSVFGLVIPIVLFLCVFFVSGFLACLFLLLFFVFILFLFFLACLFFLFYFCFLFFFNLFSDFQSLLASACHKPKLVSQIRLPANVALISTGPSQPQLMWGQRQGRPTRVQTNKSRKRVYLVVGGIIETKPNPNPQNPRSKIKTPRPKIKAPRSKFQNQNSKIQNQTASNSIQAPGV